jgi:hypothetical protein
VSDIRRQAMGWRAAGWGLHGAGLEGCSGPPHDVVVSFKLLLKVSCYACYVWHDQCCWVCDCVYQEVASLKRRILSLVEVGQPWAGVPLCSGWLSRQFICSCQRGGRLCARQCVAAAHACHDLFYRGSCRKGLAACADDLTGFHCLSCCAPHMCLGGDLASVEPGCL